MKISSFLYFSQYSDASMSAEALCNHCGLGLHGSQISFMEKLFCCHGCKIVFANLQANGLEQFYALRDRPLSPVKLLAKTNSWKYIDQPDFQLTHGLIEGDEFLNFRLYIEGTHCQACLWVLEQLPSQYEQAVSSNFMIENSMLELCINKKKGEASEIFNAIEMYGYRPHLILDDEKARKLKERETRSHLIRIGVSFFCSGNIMLLSVSSYAGADGVFRVWFDWISMGLSLPVMFYSSLPFYKSSWSAIKNKRFSIDIAIVIALIFGFSVGAFNVITQTGEVYFDTLAMLVFLLLSSRYLLAMARNKGLSSSEVRSFASQVVATKILASGQEQEVHASLLKEGDHIKVPSGSLAPADSVMIEGASYFNQSVLTGESYPVKKVIGDEILAATLNVGYEIKARVVKSVQDSQAGELFKRLAKNWGKRTEISRLADKFAKYLIICVSLLAVLVIGHFVSEGNSAEGVRRALAMIIITCPCALGFNLPIALVLGMRQLARCGIIVKDDSVIEKLIKVKNIFLDKTGTVTSHLGDVEFYWKCPKSELDNNVKALYSLQMNSKHPLAQLTKTALLERYGHLEVLEFNEYEEVKLRGPRGNVGGDLFEIYPIEEQEGKQLTYCLKKNGQLVLEVGVNESLDQKLKILVDDLQKKDKKIFLISGDSEERSAKIAKEVGIVNYYSRLDPLEKEELLKKYSNTLMIGDGVNDTLALKAADVGVAANGGVDLALLSSDVYFCNETSSSLEMLLKYAHHIYFVMKSNVFLSLLYNIFFIALALVGYITPLAAAILMPLSSVTMLVTTLVLMRRKT